MKIALAFWRHVLGRTFFYIDTSVHTRYRDTMYIAYICARAHMCTCPCDIHSFIPSYLERHLEIDEHTCCCPILSRTSFVYMSRADVGSIWRCFHIPVLRLTRGQSRWIFLGSRAEGEAERWASRGKPFSVAPTPFRAAPSSNLWAPSIDLAPREARAPWHLQEAAPSRRAVLFGRVVA